MSFSGQIYPEDTIGYLRIASDTGRHPIEPIGPGEFRIGSGPGCHLRFEGASIPDVQVVLLADRDSVLLRCTSEAPPVIVNGAEETEYRLCDGDLLEVGSHRLLFRLIAAQNRITLDEEAFVSPENSAEERSAEDLVDSINTQIELVEELSHSPDAALADLMKTVAAFGEEAAEVNRKVESATEFQQVKSLLLRHHEASRIRLESLTQVLNNVVQQQKLIADTLEVMSDRIQKLSGEGPGYQQHRQSA